MNPYEERLISLASAEKYVVNDPYINSQTKISFTHTVCNHTFQMSPNKFMQGRRCPRCSGVERYTTATYKAYIEEKTDGKWSIASAYVSNKEPLEFLCTECMSIHKMTPHLFVNTSSNPKCSCGNPRPTKDVFNRTTKTKLTKEIVQTRIDAKFGRGEYILQGEYINSMTPMSVLHTKCGVVTQKRVNAMMHHGEGCLECSGLKPIMHTISDIPISQSTAYGRNELVRFLLELYNDADEVYPGSSGIIIPDKDLTIKYIESLRDSEAYIGRTAHFDEFNEHISHGVRLLQIADHEWINKNAIVKSKLRHILGLTPTKIFARKCTFKLIDNTMANEFSDKNHIQGRPYCPYIAYGLVDKNDNLVACAAFTKGSALGYHADINNMEVIRYASILDTHIVGGFSKICNNFLKVHTYIMSLTTFADCMWSSGSLYKKAGWVQCETIGPRYTYVNPTTLQSYHRSSFTKDKIKRKFPDIYDEKLTEREMMLKTPFVRLYDAGKIKFVFHRELEVIYV